LNSAMENAIARMKNTVVGILDENISTMYLYGSVALNDFRMGWSDIDFLCLTRDSITEEKADALVLLRQRLLEEDMGNPYYRLFEGGILPLDAFVSKRPDTVVYWGTSGQRITDTYDFDSFCMYELLSSGILLHGEDVRGQFQTPSFRQLRDDVIRHYQTIRKYTVKTTGSIYSCGWMLDIARGIYTLRTGKVIAKTAAGEWALQNGICPVPEALGKAVEVRKDPLRYKDTENFHRWAAALGDDIQIFADVLEQEIEKVK
jgi:predicted nucleotidyltransferase